MAEESSRDESYRSAGIAAAIFAHEFANELSVVASAVQIMEKEAAGLTPGNNRNFGTALQHLRTGIDCLESLLSEFRGFARATSVEPTDLTCIVQELLCFEEARYAERGVRVE